MNREEWQRKKHRIQRTKRRLLAFVLLIFVGLAAYYFVDQYFFKAKAVPTALTATSNQIGPTAASTTAATDSQSSNEAAAPLSADSYSNLSQTILADEAQELDQKITAANFGGTALVVQNGQLILQKGYGFADYQQQKPNTADSHYQLASVQKGLTATLILQQIQAGNLRFDTPLSKFYPQIIGSDSITIDQMLHMTSGLKIDVSPENLYGEAGIIDFFQQNVYLQNPGKFRYSPVNFVLLAGILRQLTKKDYRQLLKETYSDRFGLQNFGYYDDWSTRENHTLSYQPVGSNNYAQQIIEPEYEFARELGTGNVDSTTGDLYWYYHQLFNGKLVKPAILQSLWTKKDGSTYYGGLYDKGDYFRGHGLERGQRTLVLITKDAKNAVILMTNSNNGQPTATLESDLFNQITGIKAKF